MTDTNKTVSHVAKKVTLADIYKSKGFELLTFYDKAILVEKQITFCITKIALVEKPNSKFSSHQWDLTILVPLDNGLSRKYWISFTPNETRDEYCNAVLEQLQNGATIVHSCKLEAIPSQYDNPFYALNFSTEECACL